MSEEEAMKAFFAPCEGCKGVPPELPHERSRLCLQCGKYRREREKKTGRMSVKDFREYVEAEKLAGREY